MQESEIPHNCINIREAFQQHFGAAPSVVSRAPGRLEILGNHTDYNQGTVLSVAVDRYMTIAARAVEGTRCRVWDAVLKEEREFDLENLEEHAKGDWANYIKGMIVAFRKHGIQVPAVEAVLSGNVPLSAGMSSSAALEMAVGLVLENLSKAEIGWLDMAKLGQACENNYIGAKTGLLDQFSSLRGKADNLVYSDFRNYTTRNVAMPKGVAFVVVNSMVKHVLTDEYNVRRAACENAVVCMARRYPEVQALRDVKLQALLKCGKRIPERTFECAAHVVGEMVRVEYGMLALAQGNLAGFGSLMFQSHDSSRYLFQNSCEELDVLVDLAHENGALGARLSGGGFGGISVHLVPEEVAADYAGKIAAGYEARTGIKAQTLLCKAADGATLL